MKRYVNIRADTIKQVFDLMERGYEIKPSNSTFNKEWFEELLSDRYKKDSGWYKLKHKKPFIVADFEGFTEYECFDTLKEAQNCLQKYEEEDKKFEIYKPNTYKIIERK